MRKLGYVLFALMAVTLLSGLASAELIAKPGTNVVLKLNDFKLTTSGMPLIGGWQPAYIRWYLIDPNGNKNVMLESRLDSVQELGTGFAGTSKDWMINENSGMLRLPAFAQTGQWTVKARLYDINKLWLIQWSNDAEVNVNTITVVSGDIMDNLMSPINIYFSIPLIGNEYSFSTPDVAIFIALFVVILVVLLNIIALIKRRKKT